jgi:D-alanine-D-alanine ligase
MQKIQKHIEIIRSTTEGYMTMRLDTCEEICTILSKRYSKVSIRVINSTSDLDKLIMAKPDLVFMGLNLLPNIDQGFHKSTFSVSEYLQTRGIEHTGSPASAVKLGRDKSRAKHRIESSGLRTPKFIVVDKDMELNEEIITLKFPLFIKPTSFGGSVGIDDDSIVHSKEALVAKVEQLKKLYFTDILIEEFLPGREFSVSLIREENSNRYIPLPLELVAPISESGNSILSCRIKKLDIEESLCVNDISLSKIISTFAAKAFLALGARDYGRIDLRLNSNGEPSFLEANLLPSLRSNPGNYFPKACRLNLAMNYESMILSIVSLGMERASMQDEQVFEPWTSPVLSPV